MLLPIFWGATLLIPRHFNRLLLFVTCNCYMLHVKCSLCVRSHVCVQEEGVEEGLRGDVICINDVISCLYYAQFAGQEV